MTTSKRHAARHVLMTVDAVGGVWRYAMDLAAGLERQFIKTTFAVFGPRPSPAQAREAEAVGKLIWCDAPLDWIVENESELSRVPEIIRDLAAREGVDLVHLNLPSQAAGLKNDIPVLAVSHSCVATWFQAVRGHGVPEPWQWQLRLNALGFRRADLVVAPSRSHAALLGQVYGAIDGLEVVHNASQVPGANKGVKQDLVLAAGRWWDDGKNGALLDAAAANIEWPVVMVGPDRGPNGQYLPIAKATHRGELSHGETMELLDLAAIFVSPSLYEPFGLAALEAARSGSALVLADIPTYRELWDGAALFVNPRDPKDLAAIINRAIRDTSLRSHYAQRARIRSLDFTLDAQAEAMARIYARLLSPAPILSAAE